ncbi:MAG: hypothetical protein ABIW30_06750 [Arenimonas sp.]
MKAWFLLSLAFLLPAGGAQAVQGTVTVHRCVDARGHITLQNDSCPKGSSDNTRQMLRPTDPPPRARLPRPRAPRLPEPPPSNYYAPIRELISPPAMYRCTSYDGIERFSEQYDPNPRCEPIVLYYPYPNYLTPAQALSCRWVEDSCVRLSDRAACGRWKTMKVEAISEATRAFSDTAAYRKSELERVRQIVDESCP